MDESKKKIRRGPAQEAFRREAKERQWKFEEKKALLKALRKYGSRYMELVLPAVPKRSEFEVRNYLKARKNVGQYRYWDPLKVKKRKYERKRNQREQEDEPSLLKWLKVVVGKTIKYPPPDNEKKDDQSNNPRDIFADRVKERLIGINAINLYHLKRTLLFIAAFEKHPLPENSYGICFHELYRTLYYYVSGDPAPWMSSFKTYSLFLATYNLLCAVIDDRDLEEEFSHFCSVQTLPDKMMFHPNMKTYLRNPPPPESTLVALEQCNILNVPGKLLQQDDTHFERFMSSLSLPHKVLAWLNMFYKSDNVTPWNKQTWEEVTQFMMNHLYGYTQKDMFYNYKVDVTLTPWKYFASEDARMYSLEENIELFKYFYMYAYLKGQNAQSHMYFKMQETRTCFNSASTSEQLNGVDELSASFMRCSLMHDVPY